MYSRDTGRGNSREGGGGACRERVERGIGARARGILARLAPYVAERDLAEEHLKGCEI